MSTRLLSPQEYAELEFLQFLADQVGVFCAETTNFRARKVAADFAAKHLPRFEELLEKLKAAQAGEPELPLAQHAA